MRNFRPGIETSIFSRAASAEWMLKLFVRRCGRDSERGEGEAPDEYHL
jgi:hypothetical protein